MILEMSSTSGDDSASHADSRENNGCTARQMYFERFKANGERLRNQLQIGSPKEPQWKTIEHALWSVRKGASLDTSVSSENLFHQDIQNLERLIMKRWPRWSDLQVATALERAMLSHDHAHSKRNKKAKPHPHASSTEIGDRGVEPFKWQKEKENLCAGTPPRRRTSPSSLRPSPTPTRHSRMRKENVLGKGHAIRQKVQAPVSDLSTSASRLLFITPAPSDDGENFRVAPIVRHRLLPSDDQRVGSVPDSAIVMGGASGGEGVDEDNSEELARVVKPIGALPSSGTVCYEAPPIGGWRVMKVVNDKAEHNLCSSRIDPDGWSHPESVNKVASGTSAVSSIYHSGNAISSSVESSARSTFRSGSGGQCDTEEAGMHSHDRLLAQQCALEQAYPDVARFLQGSIAPLVDRLPVLVQAGCISDAHLLEMTSWGEREMYNFLKRSSGGDMTEFEIEAIIRRVVVLKESGR